MSDVDDRATSATMPPMAGKTRGGISDMGALRLVDRKEWERRIRDAMHKHDGRVPAAADELGVSRRNLYRWLEEAPFRDNIYRAPAGRPT